MPSKIYFLFKVKQVAVIVWSENFFFFIITAKLLLYLHGQKTTDHLLKCDGYYLNGLVHSLKKINKKRAWVNFWRNNVIIKDNNNLCNALKCFTQTIELILFGTFFFFFLLNKIHPYFDDWFLGDAEATATAVFELLLIINSNLPLFSLVQNL